MKRYLSLILTMLCLSAYAQNPISQACFSTDPAPMVHNGRLYVFTGHDEEKADFFWMNDWRLFSTDDMVNWTDHGCPASLCDFKWSDDRAWAPQCIERNGKFYLYVPVHSKISGGMAIGVGVSDKIDGPYVDAIGKPLYEDGKWDHIDPTVLIDDDGQAYIYWGNPCLYSAKLNEDMISLASEVKRDTTLTKYTEGPWIYKVKDVSARKNKKNQGKYIMMYASNGIPECIAYSTSNAPQGPWKYEGVVMPQDNATKSFTNHSGIVDYKGHHYFFYHTGVLPGGGGFGRSASVQEFQFREDGLLPEIKYDADAYPAPIGTLNPYKRTEAETIAFCEGLHTEWNKKAPRVWVSDIHNGDWLKVREADFGNRCIAKTFQVSAASALQGGTIEVRLDSKDGELIASVDISPTDGWEEWQTFSANLLKDPEGKHDIYFLFKGYKGCKLFNFDWWEFR